MYVRLDVSSAIWHFKRAARHPDGSSQPLWQPHFEGTQVLDSEATGAHKNLGSSDPRLDAWMPVRSMPSDPFLLLQQLSIIPDPAFGLNEAEVQCRSCIAVHILCPAGYAYVRLISSVGVGESDWAFRCVFKTPEDLDDHQSLDLLVDGLDTFATVYLNDKQVHHSQNGYISYRISLTKHARKKKGDGNVLMFHFASAFREGRKLEYVTCL